jgi:hypothetical protein
LAELLSEKYIINNTFTNNDYFIYFLIKNKKILYIGASIYNGIDANIRYIVRNNYIEYDSYFILNCDINNVYTLQTEYIIKFKPIYNLKLPKKNNLYISEFGINKRWINKYGINYNSIININKLNLINFINIGEVKYYSIKDLKTIEPLFDSCCMNLERNIKKYIYIRYFIYYKSINDIAGDLYLDFCDIENIVNELKDKVYNKDSEKYKILKLHFCDGYKIKDIIKNDKLSENHVIDTIIEYLSYFGI